MNRQFECAWRKAGDVSRAKIDFADGTSMERTLGGNIVTWICDADGVVQDVMPGLMDAQAYLAGLQQGLAIASEVREANGRLAKAKLLQYRNSVQAGKWASHVMFARMHAARLSSENGQPLDSLPHIKPFPSAEAPAVIQAFDVAIAKSALIEDPIVFHVGHAKPTHFDGPIQEDTWIATNMLRPQAIALMIGRSDRTVDELSPYVYRLVLHVDARDPYLGMKEALLGRTDGFVPTPQQQAQ